MLTYGLANYEIVAYEGMIALAQVAGLADAAKLLDTCLSEEKAMAKWLHEHMLPTLQRYLDLRVEVGKEAAHCPLATGLSTVGSIRFLARRSPRVAECASTIIRPVRSRVIVTNWQLLGPRRRCNGNGEGAKRSEYSWPGGTALRIQLTHSVIRCLSSRRQGR